MEAQPAFVEYFVSLMRVRSSIAAEYTPALLCGLLARVEMPGSPLNRSKLSSHLNALNIFRLADVSACGTLHH